MLIILCFLLGALVIAVGIFFYRYFRTYYAYKGNIYRILRTAWCKDRETRQWYRAVIYKDVRSKQVFVRDRQEFTEKFHPFKKNG